VVPAPDRPGWLLAGLSPAVQGGRTALEGYRWLELNADKYHIVGLLCHYRHVTRRMIRIRDEAAFWAMGDLQPDGCLLWTGKMDAAGYGRMGPALTGSVHAHRSAWILVNGPIPPRMTVEHSCHSRTWCLLGDSCPHRRCINPDHLGLLTLGANCALQHRAVTLECPQGHPRRTLPSGQRYCPVCTASATRAWLDKDGNRAVQNAKRAERRQR